MCALWLAVLLALTLAGCGWVTDTRGSVKADGRVFFRTPRHVEQELGNTVSLVAEPELQLRSPDEHHQFAARPFYRIDPLDDERTHWDVRRADYVAALGEWELALGAGQFRWGVLESHSAVDVINQTDYVEDLLGSQKLGQPYVQVAWIGEEWAVRLYALPWFRGATFPGEKGRLRFDAVVATDFPLYDTDLGPWYPSAALRITATAGDFDLGFGVFSGISREPRFVAQLTEAAIVPAYDVSHQVSFDAQWTVEALVLKLELMGRLWSPELHPLFAAGAGVEYSFFDMDGSGVDLTFAAEYLFDRRTRDAAVTFFQNDVFTGFRLAINDTGGTTITGGAITDLEDGRVSIRGGVERRLGDHWKVGAQVDAFLGPDGALESGLLSDHHAEVEVGYYF